MTTASTATAKPASTKRAASKPVAAKAAAPAAPKAPVTSLGERKTTTWFPSVTVGSKTWSCEHTTYGHETLKTANKCLRSLLAKSSQSPAVAA
jgi:hypothetical protein